MVPFHRLATSTITSNALEILTHEGIGDPPKVYDEKTAVQFIGVIARNAMQAYSEIVPVNVGVGGYPPRIDPATQRAMAPEMMIAKIQVAPAGQTRAALDLLARLNALETNSRAMA